MNPVVLGRWTLAALMLLGATTVSVVHRHGAGGSAHAHGWGLWRLGDAPCQAAGDSRNGPERFHRHWLVFGFEICEVDPSTPAPWTNAGSSSGAPQEQCRIGAAVEAPRPAASVDEAVEATQSPALYLAFELPPAVRDRSAQAFGDSLPPPRSTRLCDAARLDRTGVRKA